MRLNRPRPFASLTLLLSVPLWLLPIPSAAQEGAQTALPVRQVTLFTSGVAYTERSGEVDGDATVPLLFRTAQINDILKSLVLLDANGQVRPATYTARDPIGHTLQSFAVDVTENVTLEQILGKLRGARVTVETANKGAVTGRIVSVEDRQVSSADNKPITAPFLNILTDSGLVSVRLNAEKSIRLDDENLNREFRDALALLASGSDEQRRQVTLHFAGSGRRQVRVGYVTEAPLWKMSYRLLVGGAGPAGGKPYLQGWALVENTTDDDWQNVRLSLVSGRPISFIQDLYQPLYLPRPIVAPDVVASPYPQTHAGNLDVNRQLADMPKIGGGAFGGVRSDALRGGFADRDGRPLGAPGPPGPAGPPAMRAGRDYTANEPASPLAIDALRQSVEAQAFGQNAGELFQYNITTPVTLPRQQAAMIPVVAQDIAADKVLLFNADSGSRFPLDAVRIRNTTGLHLKGGPVTLFDGGVYAGDAKMEDIPPGDSRLVSYAVDLTVEGERQSQGGTMTEIAMTLKRGVLTVTRRETQTTTYTLKSKADRDRTVLIEHPFRSDYKLVTPAAAAERTATLYRFAVNLPAGKSETLKVVTERPISETVAVLDVNLDSLGYYANRKDISPKLRDTLQEVVQRRRHVQELQAQAASRDAEITAISQDQDRIRKNMTALDHASALYKRYVTELDAQETRIQTLRQDASRLRTQAADADRDLRAYVDGITIAE